MRRLWKLLPFALVSAVGCGDTPTAVTNENSAAEQEAAQKKADEEERNMKDGAYDPDAPKKPAKKK
jgi:hypothetical protein